MGFGEWLWSAHNAPFLVAVGIALALAALEIASGGLSELLPLDLDVDADADTHLAGLAWLGFGKAPLSVLLGTLLSSAGVLGLLVHGLAWDLLGITTPALLASVPVATAGGLVATSVVGHAFRRLLPGTSSVVRPAGSWVGSQGRVIVALSARSGEVLIEADPVPVYLQTRATAPIPRSEPVLLTSFDPELGVYLAEPLPPLPQRPQEEP